MPKRGRPRKRRSLFTVKNFIEYTSDSDSDINNVQHNVMHEVGTSRSISGQNAERTDQENAAPLYEQENGESISSDLEGQMDNRGPLYEQENGESIYSDKEDGESINSEHDYPDQHLQQEHGNEHGQEQQQQQLDYPDQHLQQEHGNEHGQEQQQQQLDQQEQQQQNDVSDSGSDTDDDSHNGEDDYDSIMEKLKSEWLLAEIEHSTSKTASETLWNLSMKYFTQLPTARGRAKKTNQFKTIRKKMHEELLPPVELEIGYRNISTGEIEIVRDTVTPVKRYSSRNYEKIFEIGTLKV